MAPNPPRTLSRRQRAALPGGGYDVLVRTAKWALPTVAVIIAAALLAWPVMGGHDFSFILAKDRVAIATERLKIVRASYRGEDSKSQPFVITAGSAVQKTSKDPVVQLASLKAQIQLNDGPAVILANKGRYDMESETVDVDGPVSMRSAAGYAIDTRDVRIDLPTRTAHSNGAVDGRMPLGTFSADSLEADINKRTVSLEGHARLHIVQSPSR